METTYEPAPRHDSGAKRPVQAPARKDRKESSRDDAAARVSVLKDRNDDEEMEAGYGHGV